MYKPTTKFIKRLRSCYELMNTHDSSVDSVLWSRVIPSKTIDIHNALLTSDTLSLDFLSNMLSHDLYYGVDNICKSIYGAFQGVNSENISELIKFSELIGAIYHYNPAGGSLFPNHENPNAHLNVDDLLHRIDDKLGIKIEFPNPFGSDFGIVTRRGNISDRACSALYQAYRVSTLLSFENHGKKVLEIGGGMGRTAFFATKLGISDYTAVDIPLGVVRQACFLASTLGEDRVWLYGEHQNGFRSDVVKIVPPKFIDENSAMYDLVLNVDSLTEMSKSDAIKYIDWVIKSAKTFLSINHEANDFRVSELIRSSLRSFYPLRAGYVEEITFIY